MSHPRHQQDYINNALGKKLRLQREISNLSQEQLGEHFGLNRIRIGQFEAGKRPVPASLLYQFATFFNVPLTYFFDVQDATHDNLPHEAWRLMRDFGAMHNPQVRKALADVVARLAELMLAQEQASSSINQYNTRDE